MPSRIRFHDNFPMRHRRGEHDLGGGVSETLNLSDKRIQFLRGRKCHLDQHGVHTGNAVALQHVGAAVNERIKLRLLVCRQLQIDESGNMITQLLPVNYGIISQNDSLLSNLSILEETAGADKNTFEASSFNGALAFSCNNVINMASILSMNLSRPSFGFLFKKPYETNFFRCISA